MLWRFSYVELTLIYNAKSEKETPMPSLEAQIRILKDGKPVYEGKSNPVPISPSQNLKRIAAGGQMKLDSLTPGEYILQIILTDKRVKEKYNTASQWIDFEITR